jgi:hypothetical protein
VNGYAAAARITGVPVRSRATGHGAARSLAARDAETVDTGMRSVPLAERVEDWRILWRQTTFFLFDPESWR